MQVRKKKIHVTKSFLRKGDATRWAYKKEAQIDIATMGLSAAYWTLQFSKFCVIVAANSSVFIYSRRYLEHYSGIVYLLYICEHITCPAQRLI